MRGVNSLGKTTYYIVEESMLPEVYKKVVYAKNLIDNGTARNTSEAIKLADISRSAFYKYKDAVFKAKVTDVDRIELQAVLVDRAGVMSGLSNALFKNGANIITMNQSAPENGLATVSLVIGTDNLTIPENELIKSLEQINGIISIKTL